MTPIESTLFNITEQIGYAVKVTLICMLLMGAPFAWIHYKCKPGFHSYRTVFAKNFNGYWAVEGKCIRCGHIINTMKKDPDMCRTW